VRVDDGVEPVTIDTNDELTFGFSAVNVGSPYVVTIVTQPTTRDCVVSPTSAAGLTGTVSENAVIEFDCDPAPTAPQILLDICAGIDALSCPGVTNASCISDVLAERADVGALCADEFDAVFTCDTPTVNMTPAGAGCDGGSSWELAFPSPCQTELDALDVCTGGATAEIPCNYVDDDNDMMVDEDDATNTVIDMDGDGVPDACETSPALACASFTAAQLADAAAQPGATCQLPSATIPMPYQGVGLTEFAGVFLDYGDADGSYDSAWLISDGAGMKAGQYGCGDIDGTPTAQCTADSRPAWVQSELTDPEYQACLDVVNYVCQ